MRSRGRGEPDACEACGGGRGADRRAARGSAPAAAGRAAQQGDLRRQLLCQYLIDQKLPKDEWPKDVKISFLKSPTALVGHNEPIRFPPDSEEWDYENELTIVVGRTCRDVSQADADKYIFGYTILNDACVRDVPKWSGRYDSPRGKACDTFAPCGPWIVPREDLGADPNDLALKTWVDDELRQDVRTSGTAVARAAHPGVRLALHHARAGRPHLDWKRQRQRVDRARRLDEAGPGGPLRSRRHRRARQSRAGGEWRSEIPPLPPN